MKNFIILFVLSLLATGLFGEITPISVNEFNEEELKESNGEITILFAYTSQAACAVGGPAILKESVDKGLRLLNEALTNSRIGYTVRAVPEFVEVEYSNSVSSSGEVHELLNELDKIGGDFNKVHQFREKENADMVCLIFSGNAMGIAQLNGDKMVCHYSTFDESYVFPHEFGHNLGATHNAGMQIVINRKFYRTVSMNGGQAIPYFSEDRVINNPIVDDGKTFRLGDADHNNAATMRKNAPKMAQRGENLPDVAPVDSALGANLVNPDSAPMPTCGEEKVVIEKCFIPPNGALTIHHKSQDAVNISVRLLDKTNSPTNISFSTIMQPDTSIFVSPQAVQITDGDHYNVTIADITFECPIGEENATSKTITTIPGGKPIPPKTKIRDGDGNFYESVIIGTQEWLTTDLRTTKCNDGRAIPLVTDNAAWAGLNTAGYSWYNNDEGTQVANGYGALYNLYAVNACNICPTDWHVPTDAEWTTLIDYLDPDVGSDIGQTQSTVAGNKMKEAGQTHWNSDLHSPNTRATNESGWSGLPGGYRAINGSFYVLGTFGYWWSSTESGDSAWNRFLNRGSNANRMKLDKGFGFSVRCLRD